MHPTNKLKFHMLKDRSDKKKKHHTQKPIIRLVPAKIHEHNWNKNFDLETFFTNQTHNKNK